jgi:mono/diheme cytochrome c family protein
VPRDRPQPPPFEPQWLDRSLDRYLAWGIVFMVVLIGGFALYRVREPTLRADAARQQQVDYRRIGRKLFATNCAQCHGRNGEGGDSPTLNAKEFLKGASDEQIHTLVAGGVSGTAMPAWSIDFGGTLTDEQVRQIVTYMRAWERGAPSVPDWRSGKKAGM